MSRWFSAVLLAILALNCPSARGDVAIRRVEYRFEGEPFVGAVLRDNSINSRRPGVLLADEKGATHPDTRAEAAQIARLGYIVFIEDLYGKDVRPKDMGEAATAAGLDGPDHHQIRGRADAALKTLLRQSGVDVRQIAAVGFGVGGSAMIELARTGVDLEGVVCVHGPMTKPLPDDSAKVQPTFLIFAGADDSQTPPEALEAFEHEMKGAKVECTIDRLRGEGHEFSESAQRRSEETIERYLADEIPLKTAPRTNARADPVLPRGVPARVLEVLKYVDEHGEPMDGYEGGRTFGNYEHRLPATDKNGRRVKYREWDVNPHRPGVNRGVERLITGADGSAWYTDDHYETFKRIR